MAVSPKDRVLKHIQSQKAKRPASCPVGAEWVMQAQIARALVDDVPGLKETTAVSLTSDECRRRPDVSRGCVKFQGCSFVSPDVVERLYVRLVEHAKRTVAAQAAVTPVSVPTPQPKPAPQPPPVREPEPLFTDITYRGPLPETEKGIFERLVYGLIPHNSAVLIETDRDRRNLAMHLYERMLERGLLLFEGDPIRSNGTKTLVIVSMPQWLASLVWHNHKRTQREASDTADIVKRLDNITEALAAQAQATGRLAAAWEGADKELAPEASNG